MNNPPRQYRRIPRTACAAMVLLCLGACGQKEISVTEVLNHSLCQNLTPGVQRIAYTELARVRGARLLTPPGAEPEQPDEPKPELMLIAIFNGEQPTPGYGFELQGAIAEGNHVVLNYGWLSPSPTAVLAQMITSPCSVVQIADPERVHSISVIVDGEELGRLTLAG